MCGLWPAQLKVPEAGPFLFLPPSALCPCLNLDRKCLYMICDSHVLAASKILVSTVLMPNIVTQQTSMFSRFTCR